jgi:serine/threonine protein kinase
MLSTFRPKNLAARDAIRLGMDASAAPGFAHREGVIHRDIKTDNILFDEHGNAIVADFGIARAVTGYVEQTGTNMVVGTPHYFSPEQARGLALDGRGDIYSLGVTMFRSGTGVLPFQVRTGSRSRASTWKMCRRGRGRSTRR